ncbi:M16 family metallopeptidase [Polymorphobacter sp.]|uniref:M16 family metallopeptidase n=1 Tax=Polymorphobacter sp. TaxID=1909290 RepID=UPI003F709E95
MKAPSIGVTRSGLRVATCPVAGVETVAINLLADTGARFETAPLNGLAHLFEHMVFKGSERRSAREIAEAVEDVGGQLNAWTSRDATAFHARMLARDLPLGFDILGDMLVNPRFDAAELEREKHVVLQELGEARDTPDDIVFDHLQAVAFPHQALGRSILGSEETLAAITADDLRQWRDTHYQPDRLLLAVAGRIDHDDVMRLAEAAFPTRGTPGPRPAAEAVRFTAGRHDDNRRCEQAQLTLGVPAPGHHEPGHDAAMLFALAVGGGMSSRLFQEVRESRGLAYSVSAAITPYVDGGLMSVHAACARTEAAAARDLIDTVLHGAIADLSQAELDRARAQAVAGLLMALEGPQGQADHVARCLAVHGRYLPPDEIVTRLEAVTVEAARAAGAAMLAHAPARAEIGAGGGGRRKAA